MNKLNEAYDLKEMEQLLPLYSPFLQEFIKLEYGRGADKYLERVKFIGITECNNVLDAGSGFGNWSLALSALNKHVESIDICSDRLLIGKINADRADIKNINFLYSNFEDLPYEDNYFDAIFCYSALMYSDQVKSLKEFHRVLKNGGKLYIMVDLWRWYYDSKLSKNFIEKFTFFRKILPGGGRSWNTKNSIERMVKKSGFEILRYGQEGHTYYGNDKNINNELLFYKTDKEGYEKLWEICALCKK